MFCVNCGKEIESKQKFCSACGTKNRSCISKETDRILTTKEDSVSSVDSNRINTVFNRDVLTNYLNNLQTLEFAKKRLTEEKENMESRISSLCRPGFIKARNKLSDYSMHFGIIVFMAALFLIAMWIGNALNGEGFFSTFNNEIEPLVIFAEIVSVIIAVVTFIYIISDHISDGKRIKNETKAEKERLTEEGKEKELLEKRLPLITEDLNKTSHLLDDAYTINIIPAKYRNIYGIYFLYEYISTSVVSLSEALYHCDLDEISKKLDVVIEQQKVAILEMARANALNEQMVRQNEKMLKHAIAIENNTALAAQYVRVAAVNSNTIASLQTYKYFKNGT
ncbi:MAG: zinc ribbon domain-containing protein [Clostridia bacterium]|nr:zinc ribbon domain-containing protein [Clostridia bacterium]